MTSPLDLTLTEIEQLYTVTNTWGTMTRLKRMALMHDTVTNLLTARGMDAYNSLYRLTMQSVSHFLIVQLSDHK